MTGVGMFGGLQVHVSPSATQRGPRFPDKPRTKRRMRRVIARYGSWDIERPAIFTFADRLIVHPALMPALRDKARADAAKLEGVLKW